MFILQVDVSKTETQDVAVILLDKDKNKKISLQIVGDEELYGKDYVIEPKGNSSITANPGYVGPDPVTEDVKATTTTAAAPSTSLLTLFVTIWPTGVEETVPLVMVLRYTGISSTTMVGSVQTAGMAMVSTFRIGQKRNA